MSRQFRGVVARRVMATCCAAFLWCASPASAAAPPAPDALTEGTASSWGASADSATASTANDAARVKVGSQSVRLDTTAPFDCRMWAPAARNAQWNLAAAGGPSFWIYAENANLHGFQENSPWIRLGSSAGNYSDYRANYNPLSALNQWVRISVPLNGNATWTRTTTGNPDYTNIAFVELHADTWGAGFTLWVDDFGFTAQPAPPQGVGAVPGNNSVALAWQTYTDVTGTFSQYRIYRATSAFTSVAGMTAIATISGIGSTSYVDNTAVNGTAYHYAVTAAFTGGAETTQVQSVGPRTPFNETDLQVVSIARLPRYPRYAPNYTNYEITEPSGFGPYTFSAATSLGSGQTPSTPRWPTVGQSVTFTATVRNRGSNTWTGTLHGSWRRDASVVAQPTAAVNLAPGATTTFSYNFVWDNALHDISFTIDEADARPSNNSIVAGTKSAPFLSYIDRSYYENFRGETGSYPGAATEDFIDWLNRHMVRFNQMFADAACAKRVHFDLLEMLADTAPDPGIDRQPFAIFPFRYRANEGSLRLSGYYHPDDDIDYGLLHEMAHQLGLIDIYQLDVPASANQVSGQGYSAVACLMHGVSPFLSEHSAGAMNHWLHVVHGYYGQYLYQLPAELRLRILDIEGAPLEGATVKVYQYCERPGQGKVITTQIKAQGVTDASGIYTLPNVPIDGEFVPEVPTGDALGPNPFGYVAVVGTNGVLHFRVEYNGGVDYAWLDITEANVAYWQGQTVTATFDRQLALGGTVQRRPPPDMTELNATDWSAWAQGSTEQATYVDDDTARKTTGAASLKFVTDGGFDTYVRYPRTRVAQWDLSAATKLTIKVYAENPSPYGFQNGSPWIRLKDAENNYFEYQYYSGGNPSELLNQARNQWRTWEVPLNASPTTQNGWRRTTVGTPSLANIQFLEIHADTWGAGFTLWFDGVNFDLPVPGDFNNDRDVDRDDFLVFLSCATGAEVRPYASGCAGADLDDDGDVDPSDFGRWQRCQYGPGVEPPGECADE